MFIALLLLGFVGVEPFAIRQPANEMPNGATFPITGSGDAVRQVIYLLILISALGMDLVHRGVMLVQIVPWMLMAILAWCLASASWTAISDRHKRVNHDLWRVGAKHLARRSLDKPEITFSTCA